jgi:threonine/homoserine/homoserine lactone efflux protein
MIILLKGIALGFAIAAPVGPIGLLCIRRTLAYGRWIGLLSGLGAATADGCYGMIAGFGLALVSQILVNQAAWLRIIGALFLLYLGITTALAKPPTEAAKVTGAGLAGAYFSTFFLTLTNPATILSFVLLFAAFAPTGLQFGQACLLVMGVCLGSALWWLLLSFGVSLIRHRLKPAWLVWVNRIFGGVIIGFGVATFITK